MNKKEFIKIAKEYGYTEDEIKDLVELHEKDPHIPYEEITLIEKIVD